MSSDSKSTKSKVLTFAVGGALLVGASACGGGVPAHVNEPPPEVETVNEPAPAEEAPAEEAAAEEEATEEHTSNEPAPE